MSTEIIEVEVPERIVPISLENFLDMEIKPREFILSPWLPEQGLCMIQAFRGVGKTHVALGVACAIASGGEFLGWTAGRPRSVLYIDGEMPASSMQERLRNLSAQSASDELATNLQLITPDLQPNGSINLALRSDQLMLENYLDGIDLIVIDNISTLVRSPHGENDDKSWVEIQEWMLLQRARGRAVLLVHHEGKGGKQRGTSKREDVLNTVIQLKHPSDYEADLGACFEVRFLKNRDFHGEDADSILATLAEGRWIHSKLESATHDKVIELMKGEMSQADIARELDLNRSTVSRHVQRAKREGNL